MSPCTLFFYPLRPGFAGFSTPMDSAPHSLAPWRSSASFGPNTPRCASANVGSLPPMSRRLSAMGTSTARSTTGAEWLVSGKTPDGTAFEAIYDHPHGEDETAVQDYDRATHT